MDFPAIISAYCRSLIGQGFRALSTIVGIAWGTLAIVLLVAFGKGLQHDLEERAKALGQNLVIAWPQKTTQSYAGMSKGRHLRIRAEDIMSLPSQVPAIHSACAEYQDYDWLRSEAQLHSIRLSGVYPNFQDLRMMRPQSGGRFINQRDIRERRRVLFLGDRIKQDIFGNQQAVGRYVRLRNIPFQVIGVLKPKPQDSDYGGPDADRVYLPATTHAALFNRQHISNFVFRARDLASHEQAVQGMYATLGKRYRFDPSDRAAINLWDTTDDARLIYYIFLGFNGIMGGSGTLTLLIGGIGVANLMYIMVRQRTREIAILMAIGARPRLIMFQVLAQSMGLVAIGGCLGLGVAWGVMRAVAGSRFTEQIGDPVLSIPLAILTVTLLAAVGLIAGYFPARRAARLDPASILAEE